MNNILVNIIETVPNIPRYHTAIAEWLFALVFIIHLPKKHTDILRFLWHGLWFCIILGFQLLAGIMPLKFWIPNMIIAGVIMLLYIKLSTKINWIRSIYFLMIAFILAELAASLEWQISYFLQISAPDLSFIISIIVLVLIYALIFTIVMFLERRYKSRNLQFDIKNNDVISVFLIVITIFFISNISFINIYTPFTGQYPMEILYIRTLVDLAGVILLYSQREHQMVLYSTKEAFTMQVLLDKQHDQYQQSIKNAEVVNQRYHDLKHYLHLLRSESEPNKKEEYLNEIEKSIKAFDIQYKTGNHVLDILLGQKGQQIIEDQINFTCVADGEQLNFMSTLDILSLFGNAMDNAIENVKEIVPPEKRLIKLAIFNQDNLLFIKLDNYYTNALNRQGSILISTKKDQNNHGYGIKSIRNIVEKYGGNLNINTDNNWFSLMMLIPINGVTEK